MAETKISASVRRCLGERRSADVEALGRETKAFEAERNRLGASGEWRFTTAEARIKLRSFYPSEKP